MANFGFSVGDIVTVGSLAWSVYKACSNASSEFQEVAREVVSLHAAVKQLEEEASNPDSAIRRGIEQKSEPLQNLIKNIGQVLGQLDSLVLKYQSLNTKARRKRDVVRFAAEELDDIRTKVIMHTGTVHLYIGTVSVGSLGRIESKLDEIVKELRNGQRDESAIAVSDDEDDPTAWQRWRALKEELVADGFQKDDIDSHKVWIKAQLRGRIARDHGSLLRYKDINNQKAAEADARAGVLPPTHQTLADVTPRNIYNTRASSDPYGFPSLRRSPSVSSMTSVHSEVSEHDGDGNLTKRTVTITTTTTYYSASATDDSEASDQRDGAGPASSYGNRTLPPPQPGTNHIYILPPPLPTSMMGQFSSKTSSNSQKKHKCKMCDKRFTRPSSLQTHMYSHTGEKPFACLVEGCGRHFSIVSNLRRHEKVHKNKTRGYDADSDRSTLSD